MGIARVWGLQPVPIPQPNLWPLPMGFSNPWQSLLWKGCKLQRHYSCYDLTCFSLLPGMKLWLFSWYWAGLNESVLFCVWKHLCDWSHGHVFLWTASCDMLKLFYLPSYLKFLLLGSHLQALIFLSTSSWACTHGFYDLYNLSPRSHLHKTDHLNDDCRAMTNMHPLWTTQQQHHTDNL